MEKPIARERVSAAGDAAPSLLAVVWAGYKFDPIRIVRVVSHDDPKLFSARSNADNDVSTQAPEFRNPLIVDQTVRLHHAGGINVAIAGVEPLAQHSSEWRDRWMGDVPGGNNENLGTKCAYEVWSHSVKVGVMVCDGYLNWTRGSCNWRFYVLP